MVKVHNFISQALVDQLGLNVDFDVNFEVVVANEETIACTGRVCNLQIDLLGYTIASDFFVFAVLAYLVVLRIHWLKTLWPVEIDFQNLTIEFRLANKHSGIDELKHTQFAALQQTKKLYPVFRMRTSEI